MGYGPPTRSIGDVFRAVKRQFGDESGVQIEDDDLVTWINDAQTAINNRNRVLKTSTTTAGIIGQAEYSFPAVDIYVLESVHFNGVRIPNTSWAQAEESVIGIDPNPLTTGVPQLWYEWGGAIKFYPAPNTTDQIKLYYTRKPVEITSPTPDTQLLDLPDKYFPDIVRYCLQQAYEMDEDWTASQAKKDQFDQSVGDLGEQERVGQFMTYETITVYAD